MSQFLSPGIEIRSPAGNIIQSIFSSSHSPPFGHSQRILKLLAADGGRKIHRIQRQRYPREIYFYDFRNVAKLTRRTHSSFFSKPFATTITRKDRLNSRVFDKVPSLRYFMSDIISINSEYFRNITKLYLLFS